MEIFINQIQELILENTWRSWLVIFGASAILSLLGKLILKMIAKYLRFIAEKTESIWDDVIVDLIEQLYIWVLFIWISYFWTKNLSLSTHAQKIFLAIAVVTTIFQFACWGFHLIKNWRNAVLNKKIEADPSSAAALGLLYKTIQTAFITLIVLLGLSNLGVDIGALLAGLGVGGIAIALAAQNVLGDLLASLSIVLDKPFVVGDFIVIGEQKGTIEQVGIKTTRIRSLSGEEIIISNKDLLGGRIHNFKRLKERRVVQNFSISYATSPEKLDQIPLWIKGIVEKHPAAKFDRCHFYKYGPSALEYDFVFFVQDPDYTLYMNMQQQILVEILKKLKEEKVSFAYPTQTLYLNQVKNEV